MTRAHTIPRGGASRHPTPCSPLFASPPCDTCPSSTLRSHSMQRTHITPLWGHVINSSLPSCYTRSQRHFKMCHMYHFPPPQLARHASSFWLNNLIISPQTLFQRHHAISNISTTSACIFRFLDTFFRRHHHHHHHQVTALLLVFCMFFFRSSSRVRLLRVGRGFG